MWRRDCTARQRPVPVTSIPIPPGPWTCCLCTVQYCTAHTALYRGEMSGQCQPSVRPLCSGYHCRWHMDELLISSCNHNLVFVNLYDDIHQRQYSEKAPTTAHFILERSGVLSTRRIIGTFSKCCVLGTRLSGTYFSSHKPQTTEAWLHCLCFSIWRVTHIRFYWTKFVSSAPPN